MTDNSIYNLGFDHFYCILDVCSASHCPFNAAIRLLKNLFYVSPEIDLVLFHTLGLELIQGSQFVHCDFRVLRKDQDVINIYEHDVVVCTTVTYPYVRVGL